MGLPKQGGPWRVQLPLIDKNQLCLIACFKSHQESVGAFGCSQPGNQCCRQAERGISAERRGGQDALVSLTEHSWQLVVLCVVKPFAAYMSEVCITRKKACSVAV